MNKRLLCILMAALFLIRPAYAGYWESPPKEHLACTQNRAGCQVLQMVMLGTFDCFDQDDGLNGRILSSALQKLNAVNEDDRAHFIDSFGTDEAVLRTNYYIALANCLWADILYGPTHNARHREITQVLLLFLDPESHENAAEQMEVIRTGISHELMTEMSETVGVPVDFIDHLIFSENWRTLQNTPTDE